MHKYSQKLILYFSIIVLTLTRKLNFNSKSGLTVPKVVIKHNEERTNPLTLYPSFLPHYDLSFCRFKVVVETLVSIGPSILIYGGVVFVSCAF